jgi:hypothetical protein
MKTLLIAMTKRNRALGGLAGSSRDCCDDVLDSGSPAKDWTAQVRVAGLLLGLGTHFLSILLVFKNSGHILPEY